MTAFVRRHETFPGDVVFHRETSTILINVGRRMLSVRSDGQVWMVTSTLPVELASDARWELLVDASDGRKRRVVF